MADSKTFLCGVIEGFYGRPWSAGQRRELSGWMRLWGLNTYLYAPKDDLKHRTRWREFYSATESTALKTLIHICRRQGIRFVYAIAPGLDLRHSSSADASTLRRKIGQLLRLGCRHFAILFDDISPQLSREDRHRFRTIAAAQGHVANQLLRFIREHALDGTLMFCPTPYCGRMCRPSVNKSDYLREIGGVLDVSIQILWTGPDIVSETISVESIRELSSVIRRKPLLWDNLHANDYDLRRIHLGPYSGRPLELREEVLGILSNPNCEFEANFVPLRTLAMYAASKNTWNPRQAYRKALTEWLSRWSCRGNTIRAADLKLLSDCLYLPHSSGEIAKEWVTHLGDLFRTSPETWGDTLGKSLGICARLQDLFTRMTALENRELLYSLYRHVWELKEESALIRSYLAWLQTRPGPGEVFHSDEHRAGTYRGGLVARMQKLLPMNEAGTFSHRPGLNSKRRDR